MVTATAFAHAILRKAGYIVLDEAGFVNGAKVFRVDKGSIIEV